MKHIQTFESFTANVNEGKDFGDITSSIGGGNDREFSKFFTSAKVGDTFLYAPNGVELDYVDKADVNKDAADVISSVSARSAEPTRCTVVAKRSGVSLSGGSMEYDGENSEDVIYFTFEEDPKVFILTNTF